MRIMHRFHQDGLCVQFVHKKAEHVIVNTLISDLFSNSAQ